MNDRPNIFSKVTHEDMTTYLSREGVVINGDLRLELGRRYVAFLKLRAFMQKLLKKEAILKYANDCNCEDCEEIRNLMVELEI